MQVRELNHSQYLYLTEVLGVNAVLSSTSSMLPEESLSIQNLVLVSAPMSREEKDLLDKITLAFQWQDYQVVVVDESRQSLQAKVALIFGEEAKRALTSQVHVQTYISAPSLAVLLSDDTSKKILWQQMKQAMGTN